MTVPLSSWTRFNHLSSVSLRLTETLITGTPGSSQSSACGLHPADCAAVTYVFTTVSLYGTIKDGRWTVNSRTWTHIVQSLLERRLFPPTSHGGFHVLQSDHCSSLCAKATRSYTFPPASSARLLAKQNYIFKSDCRFKWIKCIKVLKIHKTVYNKTTLLLLSVEMK